MKWYGRKGRTDADYLAYLKSRCVIQGDDCWIYQGYKRAPPNDYGRISYRGKRWETHRLAFVLNKGAIPNGMSVLHSCDRPPCCNPGHLRLGTHLENMAECRAKGRNRQANQTHCKHGHEFNELNTYYVKSPRRSGGLRKCKACMRERQRETYRKNRERHNARNRIYRQRRKARSVVAFGGTDMCEGGK